VGESAWADSEVVAAAQRGDSGAARLLVDASYPHVRRFAYSLCPTPHDAEDAAQEAIIILYRRIGTLRASGALAAWMFRIVRNECLRRAKAMFGQKEASESLHHRSAEESALERIDAQTIVKAIGDLPADQRAVLIMRDIQGYPGRRVAKELGLSAAAMKSRLHRARKTIRRELQERSEGVTEREQ
jgi:RNA polymerase sigma factor (sigma-70 family)